MSLSGINILVGLIFGAKLTSMFPHPTQELNWKKKQNALLRKVKMRARSNCQLVNNVSRDKTYSPLTQNS